MLSGLVKSWSKYVLLQHSLRLQPCLWGVNVVKSDGLRCLWGSCKCIREVSITQHLCSPGHSLAMCMRTARRRDYFLEQRLPHHVLSGTLPFQHCAVHCLMLSFFGTGFFAYGVCTAATCAVLLWDWDLQCKEGKAVYILEVCLMQS